MLGWYTSCQTSYWVELEVHTTSSKFSLGASGIAHCGGCIADRFSRPLFSQASLRFAFRHPLFLSSATSVVSDHRRNTPRSDNHCNGVGKHSQISIYLHLSSLHLGPRISALGRLGLCSPAVKASKRQPLRIRRTLLTPRIVPPSQFSSPLQFLGLLLESVNPSPSHHHGRAQDTQGRLPTCLDESTPPPWIRLQLLSRPLQTKGRWCTHLSRCRPARTKCLRAQLVAAEPYLRPPSVVRGNQEALHLLVVLRDHGTRAAHSEHQVRSLCVRPQQDSDQSNQLPVSCVASLLAGARRLPSQEASLAQYSGSVAAYVFLKPLKRSVNRSLPPIIP